MTCIWRLFDSRTILRTSGSKARGCALPNGLMCRARSRASRGGIPLGRRAGKAAPDRWAIAFAVASIPARCRFPDGSKLTSRPCLYMGRECSGSAVCSIDVASQSGRRCPCSLRSSELADAVEEPNTALTATAVVVVMSLERLKRGCKVRALIPHLRTDRL